MTNRHSPGETGEREPLLHTSNNNSSREYPEASTQHHGHLNSNVSDGLPDHVSPSIDNEAIRLAALQALPWYRRPSLYWLLPLVFMAAIVLGVSSAPQEQLTIKIICKNHFKNKDTPFDEDICVTPEVQAAGALALSRIRGLKYTIAIFTVGYLTSQSDRIGRKFLVYVTLIPLMVTQLLILYMAHPSTTLGTWWLYVDAAFIGALGGGLLLDPGLNSYIADCTPREGRSLAIGYVLVALSVGMIVGPTLGKILIELTGNTGTALEVSLVTLALLCLYTVFLPESLPERTEEKPSTKTDSGVSFWEKFKTFIRSALDPMLLFLPGKIDPSSDVNVTPSRYTLLLLVGAYGCLQFAGNGVTTIFIPYTNLVFGWKATDNGPYFTFSGASSFVVFVLIFPALQAIYKRVIRKSSSSGTHSAQEEGEAHSEKRKEGAAMDLTFFVLGCFVYTAGYLIMPTFEVEPALFVACFVRALGSMALPSFMALLTSHVPVHQTGTALGGVCVMDTIIMSVSSFLFGWIFSKTATVMPSAFFLVSGSLSFIAVLLSLVIWASYRRAK